MYLQCLTFGLAVVSLKSWLAEWKEQLAEASSSSAADKRMRVDASDGDFFYSDDFAECRSQTCNAMLVTGPPGVGKTAAIYTCARELVYTVLELNTSSCRSGKQVRSLDGFFAS